MAGIAVLCEVQGGDVSRGSIGVLEEAGRLGAALGVSVDAIVCGSGLDDAKLAALGGFGASTVRVADDALLASGIAQPVVDACATAQEAAFRATRNRLGVEIMQPDLDPNQRVRMKSEWEAYGRAIKEVSRVR